MENEQDLLALKQRELTLLREKEKLHYELPHLHGFPWYKWAWEFFSTYDREMYLCAGNQLSKSSTQIRKCIDLCTNKDLWKKLWPSSISTPNCIWYLYPTKDVATEEFELKWSEFLPRGSKQDDPQYGWKPEYDARKKIYAVHFNSGMSLFFKAYSQDVSDLQTGSVFAIFADEELPVSHVPELKARLNATDGYFSMVFTATLGQEYWRRVIEGVGDEELQPHAWKRQISLFDCQEYINGTPSPWTKEKIQRAIQRCSSQDEVLRRIYGKFVVVGGRKFSGFSRDRNVIPRHQIPSDWLIYSGVDYGSGGENNHPAAMVFTAVSPDFKMGRVFRARRMDGILTTANDVLDEYIRQKGKLAPVLQTYDWSSKDFHTYATRRGEAFQKANKDQEEGVGTMNTLFKSGMLKIFDDDPELEKLITELLTLKISTRKNEAADDLCDSTRYSVMSIPWDWSVLDELQFDEQGRIREPVKAKPKTEFDQRLDFFHGRGGKVDNGPEQELEEWDELVNGGNDIDGF